MNIGVILAGGSGTRFGAALPKQYMKVAGKSVLEHTVDAFEKNNRIDEIAVVINEDYRHFVERMLLANQWTKVKKILCGGRERRDSTRSALMAYADKDGAKLILHDAVRPLLTDNIIDSLIAALDEYEAADTCVRSTDTIVMSESDEKIISAIPDRNLCYQGQTPQAFRIATLRKAYAAAELDPTFTATDDCGVVLKYLPDVKIKIVDGSAQNIKLTHIEDYYLLDKLFQLRTQKLISSDYSTLKDKVVAVIGGSEGIGKAICGLAGKVGAKVYPFSRKSTGTDICRMETIQTALDGVAQKEGGIDCVVLTAGLLRVAPISTASKASVDEMIDTNYRGAVYVAMCAYPYLRGGGALLYFTSSSYTYGRPLYGLYSSSKAAIVNLTQALSQEWADDDIRVNCVNPERTKTEMRFRNFGLEDDSTLLDPAVVAASALSVLAGDYSGQVIDVKLEDGLIL